MKSERFHVILAPPDAGIVRLALNRVQLPVSLEAGSAASSEQPSVRRRKGAGAELLRSVRI